MSRALYFVLLTVTLNWGLLAVQIALAPWQTSENSALTAVLSKQQTAWNQGDVVAFMGGYWNSPELTFAGSNGVTRGYAQVLSHYQQSYPNQDAMGHLEFTELEVHSLGERAALVLGNWHLTRKTGDVGGVFSLVFQRFPEGWKIVHDHTSVVQAKP